MPAKDELILRGATALGWESGPTRRNAIDCGDCGSCPFGCRRGAKQSRPARPPGRRVRAGARIVPDAPRRRVLIARERVQGVEATVGEPPSDRARAAGLPVVEPRALVVRARQVVLAAGALRTPVALERSGIAHPVLGRYLLLHPVAVVAGFYPERIEMWHGPSQATRSLAAIDGVRGRNGYAIELAPGHPCS